MSHPTWVCGLKRRNACLLPGDKVTPYVGVWIETGLSRFQDYRRPVTPYVGVWIETSAKLHGSHHRYVTPYVGVWIETLIVAPCMITPLSHPTWVCGLKLFLCTAANLYIVTPYVGVWIETISVRSSSVNFKSHPTWVCGLKPYTLNSYTARYGHTLRGCVD